MNNGQLRHAVANKLGLDNNAATEQPDIDSWIFQGVERVLQDTHCYVIPGTLTGFDGVSGDFDISGLGLLEVEDLYFANTVTGLERVSIPNLNRMRRQSVPTNTPVSHYALAGSNLLMFWPTPGVSDVINIDFVPIPTAMSLDADDPSTAAFGAVPVSLHKAIEYWASAEGADYDDDQTSAQGQRYRDWYDKEITRDKKLQRRRGGDRNARAVVNDRRRTSRRHDNSIYP